jgi:hypothetical protein
MTALRAAADEHGYLFPQEAFAAMIFRTPVGATVTSSLLRAVDICRDPETLLKGSEPGNRTGTNITGLELNVEQRAVSEGVGTIGERHVAAAVLEVLQGQGRLFVNGPRLLETLDYIELGRGAIRPESVADRWHGLLDSVVIVQCRDLHEIDWPTEVRSSEVVLWVGISLLNELDRLTFYHRERRVRSRAQKFGRWLSPQLDQGLTEGGVELRPMFDCASGVHLVQSVQAILTTLQRRK